MNVTKRTAQVSRLHTRGEQHSFVALAPAAMVCLQLISVAVVNPSSAQEIVAFTGATLETMGPQGTVADATLVIQNGKIVAVGRDVDIPDGARIVNAAGKTILPGLVDPYFVFGRRAPQQPSGGNRGRRGRGGFQTTPVTQGPFTRVAEYFYPYQTDFKPALRSGITTANLVTPGRGLSAIARVSLKEPESMVFQPDGFVFAAVTNQTSSLNTIRNGLDPDSASQRRGGGRGGTSGRRGVGGRGGGRGTDDQSEEDEDQEEEDLSDDSTTSLWNAIRSGERTLMVNVNNAAAVLHVLKLLSGHDKVKLTLVSTGQNLYELLDEVKDRGVTLVLQPSIDEVPYTTERMNVPRIVHEAGIPFAFSMSLSQSQLRASQDDPMFAVSYLVKSGLPRDAALRAITIEPAKILGVEETLGSLEESKLANLLIFDGDPLETGSRLEQVILEGSIVHGH